MAEDKPTLIGKYEILSVLGRGGMGIVYQARDPEIDRIVAIKTISISRDLGPLSSEVSSEDLLQRLKMEARSAGRLHHPNIVTVFDFGRDDDTSYIVMEYAEGIDLTEIIEGKYPLMVSDKLDILLQICSGLAYAHELGVVHRDMKPANIRLTSRRVAKILDFGLARFDTTKLTKTGFLSGTMAYMSPERMGGESGPSDDIFALGGIAYELLTYKRAYPGMTPPEIMYKIMSVDPPPVSTVIELPQEIDSIIQRSLAKDPQVRFQTADEFASELREFRNSAVLHDFLSDEKRRVDIEKASAFFQNPQMFGATRNESSIRKVFSDSGERSTGAYDPTALHASTAIGKRPSPGTKSSPWTHSDTPYSTAETRIDSRAAAPTSMIPRSASTEIVAEPPSPARRWWIPVAAVALIAIAAYLFLRKGQQETLSTSVVTTAPLQSRPADPLPPTATQTGSVDGAVPTWEVERELVRRLRADAAAAPLTSRQRTRYKQAEAAADLAEKKFAAKDPEAGGRLLTSSINDLQTLLEEVQDQPAAQQVPKPAVAAKNDRSKPSRVTDRPVSSGQVTSPTQTRQPERIPPVEVAVPVIAADPPAAVMEKPAVSQARVDYETPRREIGAFMSRLAKAYEDKNVAFFREHHQKFSEQMATAVRTSPSTKVEYIVESVEFDGPAKATVEARRTDAFSARGMNPATQRMTYRLTRTSDGWKVVDSQRAK